jgi:hypothetical protein
MSKIRQTLDKVDYFFVNFFNNRPLCLLSTTAGLRDIIIGLSFLLGLEQITSTQIYKNFDELVPGYSATGAGLVFMLVGLFVAATATLDRIHLAKIGLEVQAIMWLFAAIMYAADNNWMLAIGFAGFISFVSGYISYYYKYSPVWAEQKAEFKRKWLEEHALDTPVST